MVDQINGLAPGHMVRVKDKRTKEVIKNAWDLIVEAGRNTDGSNRKRKTKRFHGTKKEADAELQRLRSLYANADVVEPSNLLLKDYLRTWVQSVKSDGTEYTLRQLSWEGYVHMIEKHIIPELGSIPLVKLEPHHIAAYKEKKLNGGRLDTRKGGLSASTVNKHLIALNMALEDAASPEKQLLRVNPMRLVKRVGRKGKKSVKWKAVHNFLLANDLKVLLEAISHYDNFPIVFVGAYTGMRISELLGLRWQDINFKKGEIVVARSAHHGKNGYHINPTKNSKPRTLVVSKKVIDFLRNHKIKQDSHKKVYRLHGDDLVFVRRDGSEYNRCTVGKIFSDAARLYGFKLSFHGLRHSHATILLMAGVPVPIVSERLGHSKYSTTFDEYAHAIPSMQTEAARVFDEIMTRGNDDNRDHECQYQAADIFESVVDG